MGGYPCKPSVVFILVPTPFLSSDRGQIRIIVPRSLAASDDTRVKRNFGKYARGGISAGVIEGDNKYEKGKEKKERKKKENRGKKRGMKVIGVK
jgi:hypothetical protein